MKLDDKVIGHIAKVLQVAIITGTDVVDNLRQLDLEVDEESSKLVANNEYLKSFDQNVNFMISEAEGDSSK